MSFTLAHQSKNKAIDGKSLIPAKSSSPQNSNLIKTSADSIIHLQQTIGNQAVQRLMRSSTGFDFAKIGIQPKLKVSQPGDAYEQEADRVAEQVMRMPVSDSVMPMTMAKEERIERQCSECEMKEEEKEMEISRKPSATSNLEASDEVMNEINNIRSSSGSPLD